MKISRMIKELAETLIKVGDVEVRYFDNIASYPIEHVFLAKPFADDEGNNDPPAIWIESHEQWLINHDRICRLARADDRLARADDEKLI